MTSNGLYNLDRQPHAAEAFHYLATYYGDLPVLQDFPIGGMRGPAQAPAFSNSFPSLLYG